MDDEALELDQINLKEVESGDVIRVVLQFLKENSLLESFDALTRETGVRLNTVENVGHLSGAIKQGEWDTVLRELATIELSDMVQQNLFETIVMEMLDMRELDAAKKILRASHALRVLETADPERYGRIEGFFLRGMVAEHEWPHGGKKKNRKEIAAQVLAEISVVPPSRLLATVAQSLKWQRHMGLLPPGISFNLFRNSAPKPIRQDEQCPSTEMAPIVFAKECRPICAAFSPDGVTLATGSTDGFVELYNWVQAKLRTDLAYQAKDELLMHSCEVLCLAWSRDSELLASGDAQGGVKIWQISTGKCVRRFKTAHEKGVTSISWSSDSSKIVTSSLDWTVRMHGLRSGKTIKFFRGHTSYVQRCVYASSGLVSCATDGTVRLWDKKSGNNDKTFTVAELEGDKSAAAKHAAIVDLVVGRDKEAVIFCNRSHILYRIDPAAGKIFTRYVALDEEIEFVAVACSSLGRWLYGTTSFGLIIVFDYDTGQEEHRFAAAPADGASVEVARIAVQPHLNAICALPVVGNKAALWRPAIN